MRCRLGKRGAGVTLPERFLGRVLGVVGEQQCQVPALDQHSRTLHHGFPRQGVVGMSLDEALQLGAGLFEQVAAVHKIASLGRLVDLGAAFLIVENVLQIGR